MAALRAGKSLLPAGVSLRGLVVVGLVAGIGFTMAIFIAGLAFRDVELLAAAKLAVLLASATAAVLGLAAGGLMLSSAAAAGSAVTAEEAEAAVAVLSLVADRRVGSPQRRGERGEVTET